VYRVSRIPRFRHCNRLQYRVIVGSIGSITTNQAGKASNHEQHHNTIVGKFMGLYWSSERALHYDLHHIPVYLVSPFFPCFLSFPPKANNCKPAGLGGCRDRVKKDGVTILVAKVRWPYDMLCDASSGRSHPYPHLSPPPVDPYLYIPLSRPLDNFVAPPMSAGRRSLALCPAGKIN